MSANDALFFVVEDIIGTLNCISKHGSYELIEEIDVIPGKYYFAKQNNNYNNPQGDAKLL